MTKKIWTVELDGRKHIIELNHGYFSGKREIRVDGSLMETSQKMLGTGSDHTFQVAGHTCAVHIRTSRTTFTYDCSADGVSVTTGLPVEFINLPPGFQGGNNLAAMQYRLKLEKQLKGGASWFYIIAALSIVNSLIFIFEGNVTFVIGLGITQLIDGIAYGLSDYVNPNSIALIRTIGLVINILIAGGFVGFGILTSKKHRWALITGMIIYGLDILILIWAKDFLSIIFHLIALVGLFTGLRAVNKLMSLEKQTSAVPVLK